MAISKAGTVSFYYALIPACGNWFKINQQNYMLYVQINSCRSKIKQKQKQIQIQNKYKNKQKKFIDDNSITFVYFKI